MGEISLTLTPDAFSADAQLGWPLPDAEVEDPGLG